MRSLALALLLSITSAAAQDGPAPATLRVRDLGHAVAHYEALGFRVERRDLDRAALARQSVELTLIRAPDASSPDAPASDPFAAERALVVPVGDVGAERRRLVRAELSFAPLVAHPSRVESLLVVDPDGHRTILRPTRDLEATAIPGPGELNPIVVECVARYPTDGTHRYFWPKQGGWKGNTRDLEYGGVVFAPGDPEGRCYCCGLTFEVLVEAWRLWCFRNGRPWRIGDLDVDGARELQRQWFGSAADKSCLHTALVQNGLGFRVTSWDDARPGDFAQLWRANGSGHSVVFVAWEREGGKADGRITGVRYWSTQGSTNGIGERVESFEESAGTKRVLRDAFWLCRAGAAPAQR